MLMILEPFYIFCDATLFFCLLFFPPSVGHSQHLHYQPALLSNPEFMTFLLLSVFMFLDCLYSGLFYCEKSCRD